MQLYLSLKINLDVPFPNTIKACKIFQPIFLVALSYINDSVVVSQINNQSKNKQKDAPSLCEKVFQMKNRSYTCANREYVGSVGMFSTSPSLWFSPSLDNSWCISSNPCEKTSKHCFSHIFSVG